MMPQRRLAAAVCSGHMHRTNIVLIDVRSGSAAPGFALTWLTLVDKTRALKRQAVSVARVGTDHPLSLSGPSVFEDLHGHHPRRMPLRRCRSKLGNARTIFVLLSAVSRD